MFIFNAFFESYIIAELIATPIIIVKGHNGQQWNIIFHQLELM